MKHRVNSTTKTKPYQFDVICADKRFFDSERKALEAADVQMSTRLSLSIGVYQCSTCHYWHLTRIKPEELIDEHGAVMAKKPYK